LYRIVLLKAGKLGMLGSFYVLSGYILLLFITQSQDAASQLVPKASHCKGGARSAANQSV